MIIVATNLSDSINSKTYLYPARTFNNVDLPAPLGPSIAVNWFDLNLPLTPRKITLFPANKIRENLS